MNMRPCGFLAGLVALACAAGASAQVTVYDGATNLVTIPSVSVGSSTFTNVTLLNAGNFVFSLQGATEQKPAGPGVATYNVATSVLTLPAVKLGSDTYLDVTLLNTGNFVFSLQGATLLSQATIDEVKAFMAAFDMLWNTAVPANGTLAVSASDGCYVSNGRTRAYLLADFDADIAETVASEAHRVGSRRTNIQVLALRNVRNGDGSNRREIDIQYDILYKDGSTSLEVKETLVSGSTVGTAGCSTPQSGSALRFLGNQKLVGFSLQARASREERYAIATGAPVSPSVRYRRDIRFSVTDPLGNATYVVVNGPGPGATVNGSTVPWSWKMVSPRVMRAAPEMAGKVGNYTNFLDDDGFRYCGISGTGTPVASASDCLAFGAPGDNWGFGYTQTPDASADQGFTNQGWVVGGVYRLDVYNDDGWKTVNGHAGKTPIATYFETLKTLPRTFVEMAGSGASTDNFARLNLGALGATGVRNNGMSAAPVPINLTWNPQPSLSTTQPFRLLQGWEYLEGPKSGPVTPPSWPRLRVLNRTYPGPTATSLANWPVEPAAQGMAGRTYFEYMLYHVDRNQGVIQSRVTFQ
jgi:hypothetical protein